MLNAIELNNIWSEQSKENFIYYQRLKMNQPYINAQKRKKEQLEQAIKSWPKAQKLMNKMYNKDTTIRSSK